MNNTVAEEIRPRVKLFQAKAPQRIEFSPLRPSLEEILLPASSDDDSPNERRRKKDRRESLGQDYLQGRGLYILSAKLRGPLGADWKNPWAKNMRGPREHQVKPAGRTAAGAIDLTTESEVDETPSRKRKRKPKGLAPSTSYPSPIEELQLRDRQEVHRISSDSDSVDPSNTPSPSQRYRATTAPIRTRRAGSQDYNGNTRVREPPSRVTSKDLKVARSEHAKSRAPQDKIVGSFTKYKEQHGVEKSRKRNERAKPRETYSKKMGFFSKYLGQQGDKGSPTEGLTASQRKSLKLLELLDAQLRSPKSMEKQKGNATPSQFSDQGQQRQMRETQSTSPRSSHDLRLEEGRIKARLQSMKHALADVETWGEKSNQLLAEMSRMSSTLEDVRREIKARDQENPITGTKATKRSREDSNGEIDIPRSDRENSKKQKKAFSSDTSIQDPNLSMVNTAIKSSHPVAKSLSLKEAQSTVSSARQASKLSMRRPTTAISEHGKYVIKSPQDLMPEESSKWAHLSHRQLKKKSPGVRPPTAQNESSVPAKAMNQVTAKSRRISALPPAQVGASREGQRKLVRDQSRENGGHSNADIQPQMFNKVTELTTSHEVLTPQSASSVDSGFDDTVSNQSLLASRRLRDCSPANALLPQLTGKIRGKARIRETRDASLEKHQLEEQSGRKPKHSERSLVFRASPDDQAQDGGSDKDNPERAYEGIVEDNEVNSKVNAQVNSDDDSSTSESSIEDDDTSRSEGEYDEEIAVPKFSDLRKLLLQQTSMAPPRHDLPQDALSSQDNVTSESIKQQWNKDHSFLWDRGAAVSSWSDSTRGRNLAKRGKASLRVVPFNSRTGSRPRIVSAGTSSVDNSQPRPSLFVAGNRTAETPSLVIGKHSSSETKQGQTVPSLKDLNSRLGAKHTESSVRARVMSAAPAQLAKRSSRREPNIVKRSRSEAATASSESEGTSIASDEQDGSYFPPSGQKSDREKRYSEKLTSPQNSTQANHSEQHHDFYAKARSHFDAISGLSQELSQARSTTPALNARQVKKTMRTLPASKNVPDFQFKSVNLIDQLNSPSLSSGCYGSQGQHTPHTTRIVGFSTPCKKCVKNGHTTCACGIEVRPPQLSQEHKEANLRACSPGGTNFVAVTSKRNAECQESSIDPASSKNKDIGSTKDVGSSSIVQQEAQGISGQFPPNLSANLLESEKQTLPAPNHPDEEFISPLSTQAEMHKARLSFLNDFPSPMKQVASSQSSDQKYQSDKKTPRPERAARRSAEVSMRIEQTPELNTQQLIDNVSPFFPDTSGRKSSLLNAVRRPVDAFFGYFLRSSQHDTPTVAKENNEAPPRELELVPYSGSEDSGSVIDEPDDPVSESDDPGSEYNDTNSSSTIGTSRKALGESNRTSQKQDERAKWRDTLYAGIFKSSNPAEVTPTSSSSRIEATSHAQGSSYRNTPSGSSAASPANNTPKSLSQKKPKAQSSSNTASGSQSLQDAQRNPYQEQIFDSPVTSTGMDASLEFYREWNGRNELRGMEKVGGSNGMNTPSGTGSGSSGGGGGRRSGNGSRSGKK